MELSLIDQSVCRGWRMCITAMSIQKRHTTTGVQESLRSVYCAIQD